MKTTFFVLFLTCAGLWAQNLPMPGPMPGAPPPPSFLTNRDALRREALRRALAGDTNAPAPNNMGLPPFPAAPTAPSPVAAPDLIPPQIPNPANAATAAPNQPPAPPPPANAALPPMPPGPMPATPIPAAKSAAAAAEEMIPAGHIDFKSVDLGQVLTIYSKLVGRTVLRPSTLPAPTIVLRTETALTKREAIQALDAVLSLNGISMVNMGDKFVKAVPTTQAGTTGARIDTNDASALPELGSYVTHVVQLKYLKPTETVQVLTPFQNVAGAILPIDGAGILVLRDNAENVKRMLEMLRQIDVAPLTDFVSEVIPIKYAKAEDIASALSSIGGGGGGGTTLGGGRSSAGGGRALGTGGLGAGGLGLPGSTGLNRTGSTYPGQPGGSQVPGAFGSTPNGTPSSSSSFGARMGSILGRSSSGSSGDLQILGTTKVIADPRSNSLLVFASRQDMAMIKHIVDDLDVVLAQVLIETVILDVGLDHAWNYGISSGQQPKTFSRGVTGGGMVNNDNNQLPTGAGFLANLIQNVITGTNGSSTNGSGFTANPNNPGTAYPSGSGLSYFGQFGHFGQYPAFDLAIQAAKSDSTVNVIQKPQILTSHATPASIFVGNTVPYVTSTYYGGAYGGGPSSAYSQLSVGIGLNVTPFINPDGLVVMQIDETIDEISGSTAITGVGNVPNTTHRQLSAELAVRDRETIMLGGFIRNSDSKTKSGVPILSDIPLIGALFTEKGSEKQRSELMVLMRPTVLKTPELASRQVAEEKKKLPGVLRAEREFNQDEKAELKRLEKEIKDMKDKDKSSSDEEYRFKDPAPEMPETPTSAAPAPRPFTPILPSAAPSTPPQTPATPAPVAPPAAP